MEDIIIYCAAEMARLAETIPYGKIALLLSLILILDHGVRHLEDRFHDWKGRWYCKLALVVLGLGLICHAIYICGQIH